MGRHYEVVPEHLSAWLESQPVFFVASAPLSADGHVNVSPQGGDTLRVLAPNEVAYLDLTGSGAETIAHSRENGRLTIMFCALDGAPNIVRLFGHSEAVLIGDPRFEQLAQRFPANPGARAVIRLEVNDVTTSCGYAVPRMELLEPRNVLDEWAERKGDEGLMEYRATKNETSLDGRVAFD